MRVVKVKVKHCKCRATPPPPLPLKVIDLADNINILSLLPASLLCLKVDFADKSNAIFQIFDSQ